MRRPGISALCRVHRVTPLAEILCILCRGRAFRLHRLRKSGPIPCCLLVERYTVTPLVGNRCIGSGFTFGEIGNLRLCVVPRFVWLHRFDGNPRTSGYTHFGKSGNLAPPVQNGTRLHLFEEIAVLGPGYPSLEEISCSVLE